MRRLPVPLLLALALLAGCTGGDGGEEPPADPPGTLRVLAGSELRDVEPLLGQIRDATGVNLTFEYSGTLEGAERITAGGPTRPALAWCTCGLWKSGSKNCTDGRGNAAPVGMVANTLG